MFCSEEPQCSGGYHTYLSAYDTANDVYLVPFGISRDGRKIYGPKKSDGSYWQPCDIDYCNGLYIENEYVYVAT